MDLLLGLDVGTTATKALLFDLGGRVVASATHAYGLITPRQGWVEQDPEDLWRSVVATCRAVAVILAGVGAGVLADPEAGYDVFRGQEAQLEPDAERQEMYDDCFAAYRATFQSLNRYE